MTLVVLQYNNYMNRQLKMEKTVVDYYDKSKQYFVVDNFDFNPADGVDTTAVVGGEHYDYYDSDYLLVCDGNEIVSRWFVLDANRSRYGQYRLSLHRDVLADAYNVWSKAPAYVEKGFCSYTDPAIYNSENFDANQIKTSEVSLYDKSLTPWIVGFIKGDVEKTTLIGKEIEIPADTAIEVSGIGNYWLQPGTYRGQLNITGIAFNYVVGSLGSTVKIDSNFNYNPLLETGSFTTNIPTYTNNIVANTVISAFRATSNLFSDVFTSTKITSLTTSKILNSTIMLTRVDPLFTIH